MTREEAIQWLKEMKDTIELYNDLSKSYTFDKYPQAIDMAISALHFEADCRSCMWREKYEEQTEPSDLISHEEAWNTIESDLISRADAIKELKHLLYETAMNNKDNADIYVDIAENRIDIWLNLVPSADIPTEDYSDLPDIPRAYYEKIVGNMSHEINMLKQQLEDRLSVSAERVVRCKDCEYFKKIAEKSDSGLCHRDIVASAWKENGYCSRAKMKGEK